MTVAHMQEAAPVVTPVHRLAPECKVAATIVFAVGIAVVAHGAWGVLALQALVLAVIAAVSRCSPIELARRIVFEIPFVLVVVLLPFAAEDRHAGLIAAGTIAIKATLVVLATGVLAQTTTPPEIVAGVERLGVPRPITQVAAFAVRYLQLVNDELRALALARRARGDDARWLSQARIVARTIGTLAARTFDRGERVHRAMLARGYDARPPALALHDKPTRMKWAAALAVPAGVLVLGVAG